MEVLADRIAAAAEPHDLESVPSAWEAAIAANPQSHKEGSISKTCFVFLSKPGWDWILYQDRAEKIGALAQKITGELGLRYEELRATPCCLKSSSIRATRMCQPSSSATSASLELDPFASSLQEYDGRFLPHCAALVLWEPEKKGATTAMRAGRGCAT